MEKAPIFLIVGACSANILAVFFTKLSQGMTKWLETLIAILLISLTQWFIARALSAGFPVGPTITTVVLVVMLASTLIGIAFGESLTKFQCAGLVLAATAIILTNLQ